jgi:hypothetical protein
MKHTHTDSDYYDYYHTKLYSTNKQQPKPISERRSDESENLTGSPQKKKKNIQMVFGPKTKIGRGCEKISSQELVISLYFSVLCRTQIKQFDRSSASLHSTRSPRVLGEIFFSSYTRRRRI